MKLYGFHGLRPGGTAPVRGYHVAAETEADARAQLAPLLRDAGLVAGEPLFVIDQARWARKVVMDVEWSWPKA